MSYQEEELALPNSTLNSERVKQKTNPIAEYATAGIICFIFAFFIYVMAKPEEHKGPPQGNSSTQSGLPSNHPEVDNEKNERFATTPSKCPINTVSQAG